MMDFEQYDGSAILSGQQTKKKKANKTAPTEIGKLKLESDNNGAMLCAMYYIRKTKYTLGESLDKIGSRQDKFFFTVSGGKLLCISMVPQGGAFNLLNSKPNLFADLVYSFESHPYVCTPHRADFLPPRCAAATLRSLTKKGSLRDFVFQATPTSTYASKYTKADVLGEKLMAKFGRQILEALWYLKINHFPYYHLHAGNVILEGGAAKISDFENVLLCLKPFHLNMYRIYHEKVEADAVAFGCVLAEMAYGVIIKDKSSIDTCLESLQCPQQIKKVLETIFRPTAPVSVEMLLRMEPFCSEEIASCPRKRLQFEPIEEKLLGAAYEAMENMIKKGTLVERRTAGKKKHLRQVESRDFNQSGIDFSRKSAKSGLPSSSATMSATYQPSPSSTAATPTKSAMSSTSSAKAAPKTTAPTSPIARETVPAAPVPQPPTIPTAPPAPAASNMPEMTTGRQNLLASITAFNKNALRKTVL